MAAPINDTTAVSQIINNLEGNTLSTLLEAGQTDWVDKITSAWELLKLDLRLDKEIDIDDLSTTDSEGNTNNLQNDLNYANAFLTLSIIFYDAADNIAQTGENIFLQKAERYELKYKNILDKIKYQYDSDSDGNADTELISGTELAI